MAEKIKLQTSFLALMQYARELSDAKKTGDKEKIALAQKRHDDYKDICLKSDSISLNCTIGTISRNFKGK